MSIDLSSFPAVDSATKVRVICGLAESCSLQELKAVHQEITNLLKRDFLSLLPPELTCRIISYLCVADVVNCLLVTKQWNYVVTMCSPFWRKYCEKRGFSGLVLARQASRFPTLKDLAFSYLKFHNICERFRSSVTVDRDMGLVVHCISAKKDAVDGLELTCIVQGCDQITLRGFKIEDSQAREVASLPIVSHQCNVIWCSLTTNHTLVYTSDAQWIRMTRSNSDWQITGSWADAIYSAVFFRFAVCPKCALIMVAGANSVNSDWSVRLIRLSSDDETAITEKILRFAFLPNSEWCRIKKIALLPGSDSTCLNPGCCGSHKVIFQLAAGITLYTLDEADTFTFSGPVWNTSIDSFRSLDYNGVFCLSFGEKLVALCDSTGLNIWEVDTGRLFAHCKLMEPSQCISVGHLFAFLGSISSQRTHVLQIVTGWYLMSNISRCFNGVMSVLCTQDWLSYIPATTEEASLLIAECDGQRSSASHIIALSTHNS